jgi:hypothetical protein
MEVEAEEEEAMERVLKLVEMEELVELQEQAALEITEVSVPQVERALAVAEGADLGLLVVSPTQALEPLEQMVDQEAVEVGAV